MRGAMDRQGWSLTQDDPSGQARWSRGFSTALFPHTSSLTLSAVRPSLWWLVPRSRVLEQLQLVGKVSGLCIRSSV